VSDDAPGLAIEMTTRHGAVLLSRGDDVIDVADVPAERQASERLVAVAADLLASHGVAPRELSAIHVSRGPGSFTGTRVAVTFAKTLALTTGASLVAVETAEVIRRLVPGGGRVGVVLDARRGAIWLQPFEGNAAGEPRLLDAADLPAAMPPPATLVGEGLDYFREAIARHAGYELWPTWRPDVRDVFTLGRGKLAAGRLADVDGLVPRYVREPQAVEKRREAGA